MASDKKESGRENDEFIMSALMDGNCNRQPAGAGEKGQVQLKCEYRKETRVLTMTIPVLFASLLRKVRELYNITEGELSMFMTLPNGEIPMAVSSQAELDRALDCLRSCQAGPSPRRRTLRLLLAPRPPQPGPHRRPLPHPGAPPAPAPGEWGARLDRSGSPPPGHLRPEEAAQMERSTSFPPSAAGEGEFIPDAAFSPARSTDSSYSGSRSSLFDAFPGSASYSQGRSAGGSTYPSRVPPAELSEHQALGGGRQTFPRMRGAVLAPSAMDRTPPSLAAVVGPGRSHTSSTSSGVTSSVDSPAAAGDGRYRSAEENEAPLTPGQWQKGRLLGRGAFGQVHLCKDTETGREFAMKEVLFGDNGSAGEVGRQTAALENEIRLFRSVSHPALVQYFGAERDERGLYIFMEYMPGGSVKDEIKQYGALTETLARKYTRQILTGLSYLHQTTVIHRDIKAANILRDSAGNVKLADFGAARQLQTICTFSGAKSFCGTPCWMAPEVIRGETYNTAADVWSLACTLVEMITRYPPWHELEPMAALFRIATVARPEYALPADVSPALVDFLNQAFRSDPKARPSAEALIRHRFCEAI